MALTAQPHDVEIDLARSALLVVDMQNDFCDDAGWFGRRGVDLGPIQRIIEPVSRAVEVARDHGLPVIFVNWGLRADALEMAPGHLAFGRLFGRASGYAEPDAESNEPALVTGTWGAQTVDALVPQPLDIVVHKKRFSGFWHNELDAILRRLDITTLIFTGVNTDRCVLSTLQDATFCGYDAVLIDDATATVSANRVRESACEIIRTIYGFISTLSAFAGPDQSTAHQ